MQQPHQTITEYKDLELITLIDMVAELTGTYTRLIAKNGFSPEAEACSQIINKLQSAIKIKKNMEEKAVGMAADGYQAQG